MSPDDPVNRFRGLFGVNGGDVQPGNVGGSRTVVATCHEVLQLPDPLLFDYFVAWDARTDGRSPLASALGLINLGQWEGAWAIAQLHYDQVLKQEAKEKKRLHKGHPLCNIALVGRAIGSPTLTRTYGLLSSAGDIAWEHNDQELRYGGLGPTILEQFESHTAQHEWRNRIRETLATIPTNKPIYLEALLASRWFSSQYSQHFLNLWEVSEHGGIPFVEVLLNAIVNPASVPHTTTGARFEAAAGLLLSATPGFEVDSARKTTDEQIDLVVWYTPDRLTQIGIDPGCGLVECKSSAERVSVGELRDFGAKCLFHRVKFGILLTQAGTTGSTDKFEEPQYAELVRRRFQIDGLTILVLSMADIRCRHQELRGVAESLLADHRRLVFGPVP